jgi:hypothetical protein
MSHLRLVPPPAPAAQDAQDAIPAPRVPVMPAVTVPEQRRPGSAYDDPSVVALSFFQSASGLCLCRSCTMKRHPAFGNT